jgi:hypothetical protein
VVRLAPSSVVAAVLAVELVQVLDQAASAAVLPADPSAEAAQVAAAGSAAIRVVAARVVALQGAWAVHHDHPLVPRVPLAGLHWVDRVERVHQQAVLPWRVPKTRIDARGVAPVSSRPERPCG